MDLFEQLRRRAGNIPWGTFAHVVAENLHVRTDAATEVIEQLKEWGAHLTKNALLKWTGSVASPVACESPDVSSGRPKKCPAVGVVRCDVCGRPCCLGHARVDYLGDAICEVCIGDAKARARGRTPEWANQAWGEPQARRPPPEPAGGMSTGQALKALKLDADASWDDVKKRYRKLVVQYNADRPQSDAKREQNTKRLKKYNAAFEVLRKHFESKEAA